jgi:hypothetical protein
MWISAIGGTEVGSVNAGTDTAILKAVNGGLTSSHTGSTPDVIAGTAILSTTGTGGSIGTSANPLLTQIGTLRASTAGSGSITITNVAAGGNLNVASASTASGSGNAITLAASGGNLTTTATGGTAAISTPTFVTLTASGSVLSGSAAGIFDVQGSGLAITAGTGIGTAANPFRSQVSVLSAAGGSGDVVIGNTGDLSIVGTGVSSTGGNVVVSTTGTLLVGANVTDPGSGTVTLGAGPSLTVPSGVTVHSAGAITLNGDVLNVGPTTINVTGASLQGASATLNGNNASDTFNVSPSASTPITVNGSNPTPPASPGDTLNVNLTGVPTPTLFAALSSSGYSGSWSFGGGLKSISFTGIETLNPASQFSYNPATKALTITGTNFLFQQATTADAAGTHTTYTFTMDGVSEAYTDQQVTSVTVNGTGAGAVANVYTNDTYTGTDGMTHETKEIDQLGAGGSGQVYKLDVSNNASLFMQLNSFPTSYAFAGPADQGALYGTTGETNFLVTTPLDSYINSATQLHVVVGAGSLYGYSATANDWAYHYDGSGASTFQVSGIAYSFMVGTNNGRSFFNEAVNFRHNEGIALHLGDLAIFYDSPANDVYSSSLVSGQDSSYMYSNDAHGNLDEYDAALAFTTVNAYSFVGGTDFAYNNDPAHSHVHGFTILSGSAG